MRNLFSSCSTFLLLCMSLVSCNEIDPGSTTLRGDLFGSVLTFDEFGQPLSEHSGVEVAVEGSQPIASAVTDASGKFILENVPMGTYNISFQKDGFQSRKIFSYPFVGGEVPTYFNSSVYLSKISTTSITSFNISVTDTGNPDPQKYTMVQVEFSTLPTSTSSQPRILRAYLSMSNDVSVESYEYQLNLGTTGSDLIRLNKLPSGTMWYAIAYPEPALCNPYYDPFKEVYVYSCFGEPSDIISFIVP